MYKLLLSWRYLKTRFIALASIISVTLGVATLIVVNSVMAGFVDQMKNRLHGILSDVEISTQMFSEIPYPERHVEIIKDTLGEELEEATCVVRTPALLSFDVRGRQWTQQIMLLGIDEWINQQGLATEYPTQSVPAPTRLADKAILDLALDSGEIETIVWATGFRPDYSWLQVPVLDHKGRIRHQGGITAVPGLYAMGLPFMRKRKSGFILGAGDDARFIAGQLRAGLDTSGITEMAPTKLAREALG